MVMGTREARVHLSSTRTVDGTVYKLEKDRGFGFIRGDDGMSRFFHMRDVKDVPFDMLKQGQRVQFTPSLDPDHENKPRAREVRIL